MVLHTVIVVWCANDVSTWSSAKGGVLFKAKACTSEMPANVKKLHDVLAQYDAGIIIGPAASHAWGIESFWTRYTFAFGSPDSLVALQDATGVQAKPS